MSKPITPKQALKDAHVKYLRQTSTMPDEALQSIASGRNWSLGTTNGITNAIIHYVKYLGGFANRINSTGRRIKVDSGKEIYIPGTTKRGTPDVDIVFNGLPIKVEVKNKKTRDKMSAKQLEVKEQLEKAGAIYLIADSFDTFHAQFHQIIDQKPA